VNRVLLASVAVATLAIAACSSDSDGGSFGTGQPAVTGTAATDRAGSAPTDSATTTAATTTAPSVGGSEAPTTTGAPTGPLVEPSVALFDIGSFDQPVGVAARPGGGEIYVTEQPGRVVAVTDLSADVVLDITDLTDARGEQGLLGLAFHPTADLAYVHFTDTNGDTVVAEFAVDPTPHSSTGAATARCSPSTSPTQPQRRPTRLRP
jgi:glucose/arabinose dehydrogenase